MKKTGKAYAFFDCDASKEEIEKELPFIRELVKTPSNLELSLTEGVYKFIATKVLGKKWLEGKPIDTQLRDIAIEAKKSEMKYVIDATYPDATDYQTAQELSTILNQAYQSPLYKKGEPFKGEIVYQERERGEYTFLD